jgi:GTP cyclohydrolase I
MTKPTREEAEAAVRTLIAYAGDDPSREGVLETPGRIVRAYDEWFSGYDSDPKEHLKKTFGENAGYSGMVVVRDIEINSWCEHHGAHIKGTATIAYIPKDRVVGLSKLARVAEGYACRYQVQERLTAQIANAIQEVLDPVGVAVLIRAEHGCMSTRGVRQHGTDTVTSSLRGVFKTDHQARAEFMQIADLHK